MNKNIALVIRNLNASYGAHFVYLQLWKMKPFYQCGLKNVPNAYYIFGVSSDQNLARFRGVQTGDRILVVKNSNCILVINALHSNGKIKTGAYYIDHILGKLKTGNKILMVSKDPQRIRGISRPEKNNVVWTGRGKVVSSLADLKL